MHAAVCHDHSSLDSIVVTEMPDPPIAPGRVRIAVEAAGVNYVDALFCLNRYQITVPPPFVPGSEVAGRVVEVAEGVERPQIGDRVRAFVGLGGFASEVVVNAAHVLPILDSVDFATAAAMGQSYSTALFTLTRRYRATRDDVIVVFGAGGGVGLACIDVATGVGAEVIAVASTDEKRQAARAMGATHVLATADPELSSALRQIAGRRPTCVIDSVGGPATEMGLRALGEHGALMIVGFASGSIAPIPANQVLLRNRCVVGVDWGAWAMSNAIGNAELGLEIDGALADGRIAPSRPETLPLDDAAEALRRLLDRQATGKLALIP